MNHSADYLDIIGPEPDLSDYRDLHRWDKWGVWFRRFSKLAPFSNGTVDEDGTVHYTPVLRSQRTRIFRENK
jgi:hypothetical protein